MLTTRILTAAALVPLVLAGLFLLPPRSWGLAATLVIAIGAWEWATLTALRGMLRAGFVVVTVATALALLWLPAFRFDAGWPTPVVVVVCGAATAFWLAVVPFWLRGQWHMRSAFAAAAVGWLVLVATWVAIVAMQAQSPWRVLAAMAVVWIADTAAYFSGRTFGRHKLAPAISPGKTWEGVAGALAAVALYATLLVAWSPGALATALPVAGWVLLAVAVAGISVCGDLFESLMKRQAGVKDSGRILPGHGGVLDRIDALLAAMPPFAVAAVLLA
ncbi:MAG: phosphatidate cytidylyltransferase [Casimicrobiaceae bacterium]